MNKNKIFFLAFSVIIFTGFTNKSFAYDNVEDKCFTENTGKKVCIGNITNSEVNFIVDNETKLIKAKAKIEFKSLNNSDKVFFFFDPTIYKAKLNDKSIKIEKRKTPKNQDSIITIPLEKGINQYNLELEYNVPKLTKWGFNWKPFFWKTDYSDSIDARFINAFAPTSFEFNRYPMTYNFEFKGIKENIDIFTSASETKKLGNNKFTLNFDKSSNISSPYFEFTTLKYLSHSFVYNGKYNPIPVTLYFPKDLGKPKKISDETLIKNTEKSITETIKKFETTMGQYAYDKLLVNLYSLQEGDLPLKLEYSMEYGGGIVSRFELIPHEICHQWFGRGASPIDGQSGFVDEVICDWYDYKNPVLKPKLRKHTLLSPKDNFTLRTPEESYNQGIFLGEISYIYKKNNVDIYHILRDFYQKYRLSNYSTNDFIKFFEKYNYKDLKPYFKRYVYGDRKSSEK